MIANCRGCNCEIMEAYTLVKSGYHIATTKKHEFIGKGHLFILFVNDNGKIVFGG